MKKHKRLAYNTKQVNMESVNFSEVEKSIKFIDEPSFADHGEIDDDNVQIFTPSDIVTGMLKTIGFNNVDDYSQTVLEPSSGDGAFTGIILERRLKKALKDKEHFPALALRGLSTIYSIEMDKDLIEKQRNNIYTILVLFCKKAQYVPTDQFDLLARAIIARNFIWGMTNVNFPLSLIMPDVVYKMPEAEDNNYISEKFPVWDIHDDLSYSVVYEDPEL